MRRPPPERLVLLGHPVAHSRSPQMHNAALAAAGIRARYEALDISPEQFDSTVRELVREGAAGNVTIPHKERMYAACATLSPIARRVGAVNTWWVDADGALSGDNTDVGGVHEAVRRLFDVATVPSNLKVGLLGAGGAAAAVVAAVESWPSATVRVYNRTDARGRALCERFGAFAQSTDDARSLAHADLVVNATSIGMRDDATPFDVATLHDGARILDLVYRHGGGGNAARPRGARARVGGRRRPRDARRAGGACIRAMVRRSAGSPDDVAGGGNRLAPHLGRLTTAARPVAAALADFLLPRACTVCERGLDHGEHGLVCGRCWALLPGLPWPRCDRCGHPTYGERCRWCELLPPFVRAARSVAWAAGHVGLGVVHALKYGGWHRVAGEMAARMARCDWPRDVAEERTAIVPVPLSAKRERERGYNQSERLARGLAAAWRIPMWTDVLARTRHTETQTRLAPDERFRNVTGAFSAPPSARDALRGAHVVLVDDVVTTAATLNACAAALCAGGARIVSFVTFGRAPALGDRL